MRLTAGQRASATLTRAIQAHVRGTTAPYKYPREIIYVTELPKTISGKIRRAELREWLKGGIPEGVQISPALAEVRVGSDGNSVTSVANTAAFP